MHLRPYQTVGVNQIREHYRQRRRKVLLYLSTGGGKTVVFSHIMKATAERGKRCIMVVRGRELVNQASRRLFHEHVPHGVRMASHWNKNYGAPIQICSIDTLNSRRDYPEADLVVIDEAHLFTSQGCREFIEHYPNAHILAVTATPFTQEPLTHLADAVVHPITTQELMDQGFLVPPRYYAPSAPDLKGVRTQHGDFISKQLEERMDTLTGDIVGHWKNIARGRPTICFAVNIHHSKTIVSQFQAHGIRAEHIEGNNSESEREAVLGRLKSGETEIVSNVGVLCTGVDLPFVSCLIMARPTKSYNLYIQQAGRGTRPAPGKSDFIILDHAGNVLRHGFITQEREVILEGKQKSFEGPAARSCKQCYAIFTGPYCKDCGPPVELTGTGDRIVLADDGELQELKTMPFSAEVLQFIMRCRDIQKKRGYNQGWVFHQVKDKYGAEIAQQVYPKRRSSSWLF